MYSPNNPIGYCSRSPVNNSKENLIKKQAPDLGEMGEEQLSVSRYDLMCWMRYSKGFDFEAGGVGFERLLVRYMCPLLIKKQICNSFLKIRDM